jgi:LysM repeat protein
MGRAPTESSSPNLFASLGRELSSSSPSNPPLVNRETETASTSRYILPKDLDGAIRQLDDQELDRLVAAALEERARRKKPSVPEESQSKRLAEADAVSLPQGKLNAVKAAFKAGVTPSRIAREFGIPLSDVKKAIRR